MQKFAHGSPGSPASDRLRPGLFGFVKFANQRRQDMRGLQIVVVIWPIHVRWHRADKIAAVLPAISLAHLKAGDLGHGVPFIGRFERAGEQVIFFKRLGREFRVNTGTAQKEQFFDARFTRAVN